MDDSQLLDWFRGYLFKELGVRKECVTLEADFQRDLGADSLDYITLALEIEDKFGITIDDADVEQIKTVGDAIQYIRGRQIDHLKPE